MDFKYLVKIYVPEIESSFEMYIPINKKIDVVIRIINKAISDTILDEYPIKENLRICNRRTGKIYDAGYYVRNTDIENGTQLVLF